MKMITIKTVTLHLGAFVISSFKKIMKNFIHAIDAFKSNDVDYTDYDSLFNEDKQWKRLYE